jgi:hypothetical protein
MPAELDDADRAEGRHDQCPGHSGQQQRDPQRDSAVPSEKADLRAAGVLEDEDEQQREQARSRPRNRQMQRPGGCGVDERVQPSVAQEQCRERRREIGGLAVARLRLEG